MAKIVIIDDEPAMVEVIVTLCREKGHQVFPFNAAPKAVEQLDSIAPQVVIADIKMETMTGFDVLRHIREHHPFVAINCSALPENLLESELFGHKKGSFTGAVADKRGLFEEANLGTIFLDEVNSMAPALQTKLLRVLQEREVRRVGDNKSSPVNVRVVGATNEPLQPKLKDGTFREDLYYRLAVIPIEIPTLRERLEDVPLLVNHFLQKQASATGGEPKKIDAEAVDILCHYNYPGNVRELENAIERACALCENDLILPTDLPPHIVSHAKGDKADQVLASMPVGQTLDDFVQQQERNYIEATLQHCDDSREKAANMLGISMATLYRKIEPKKK